MGLDPATAAYQQHGYNDKPVETRLGPHRYLIPANYFYDQIGPDFQGGVALSVQWPDLQPLPPATNFHNDMETFYKAIRIVVDYIDRVPIDTLLERMTRAGGASDARDDPNENLHLRIEGEPIHGLTPYYADLGKIESHFHKTGAYTNRERLLAWAKDWYVARDTHGKLTTLIKCDSRELPDGLTIQGDGVVDGETNNASCEHSMVIAGDNISVSIGYNRVFLKDWKRIEDRVRALFAQYRAR